MSEEFSFTVLNSCSSSVKSVYRDVEKHLVKIVTVSSHLCFNETCSNDTILPTFTNIYIYIYIYINTCLLMQCIWLQIIVIFMCETRLNEKKKLCEM